jgi:hypothetical protein
MSWLPAWCYGKCRMCYLQRRVYCPRWKNHAC